MLQKKKDVKKIYLGFSFTMNVGSNPFQENVAAFSRPLKVF